MPTEIKSTPVRAASLTDSSVMPPEASVNALPCAISTAVAIISRRHVIEQDSIYACLKRLCNLLQTLCLDLDLQ